MLAGAAALIAALIVGTAAYKNGKSDGSVVAGPTQQRTVQRTVGATVHATITKQPIVRRVVATKTRTATVTYTPPPPHQYRDGTYVVGVDIKAGEYHTSGASFCYWARLSSLNTNDIIDNSNETGPQTVDVESSDRAFQVQGDCTFGRVH